MNLQRNSEYGGALNFSWGPKVVGGANLKLINAGLPPGNTANLPFGSPPTLAYVSSPLSTGAPITSIPINIGFSGIGLQVALPSGSKIQLNDGAGHTQIFTTTGAAIGATSIPVTSQTPNFAYPSGTGVQFLMVGPSVDFQNFYWRDAAVNITGGTGVVISVDGASTGMSSGTVIVPSGKTLGLGAYTVAPSWNWTLL